MTDEEKNVEKENKSKNKKSNELEELKQMILKLQEDNNNLLEKLKYKEAEIVNYRKRKDEEVENLLKYSNKDLILELLPIVDNFERAIKLDDNNLDDELSKFLNGFKMMYSSLTQILNNFGVKEINRVGEIFDPNCEQALLTDSVVDKQNDEVLEVLLKGYMLKDRIIRPATVKINKIENNNEGKGDKNE